MAREWKLCLCFIFIYSPTPSSSLTNRHLMQENIGLNNVETYIESLSMQMACSLTRYGSIRLATKFLRFFEFVFFNHKNTTSSQQYMPRCYIWPVVNALVEKGSRVRRSPATSGERSHRGPFWGRLRCRIFSCANDSTESETNGSPVGAKSGE